MIESVKHFIVANWPWLVVGAVLIVEDIIARSPLKSNSTIQMVSSWLRMIPILGRVFAVLAPKPPKKYLDDENKETYVPPPVALLLLAGALGFGVAVGGCAGLRSVSYKGLTIATDGATGAAEQLPGACEVAELSAAKKQPTKELKISESGKVHADCEATAKALSATHDGLVAARNLVANAPDKASDWARWVLSAVQLYQDVRPLVAKYGIKMPEVKP